MRSIARRLGIAGTATLISQAAFAAYPGIGADGACGVNLSWENHQASSWYIEVQGLADKAISDGIKYENDADIQAGLSALHWGFSKQAADGSFPGTGDPFHSTSIFIAEAAHALLSLQTYRPKTYSKNYSAVVSSYIPQLSSAAYWLISPSELTVGKFFDQPYTHRRYIAAAALAQSAALSGKQDLFAAAIPFINDGLSLQLSNGVNPELGGFDVAYQVTGCQFADDFLSVCTDPTLFAEVNGMVDRAMTWELAKIQPDGTIVWAGSTRCGVEKDRAGLVKYPAASDIDPVFRMAYENFGSMRFHLADLYLAPRHYPGQTQTMSPDGALSNNIAYDQDRATTYALGLQQFGNQWLVGGMERSDAAMMQYGLSTIQWGADQQLPDGSFGPTTTKAYNTAKFLESIDRASEAIAYFGNFAPPISSNAAASANNIPETLEAGCEWLTSPVGSPMMNADIGYTSHYWLYAALFASAGTKNSNANWLALADRFASLALGMQLSNGVNPELGQPDSNYQPMDVLYASRYLQYCKSATLLARTEQMISSATLWEFNRLNNQGDLQATSSSPVDYFSIANAFRVAYQITGDTRYLVGDNWIGFGHGYMGSWNGR